MRCYTKKLCNTGPTIGINVCLLNATKMYCNNYYLGYCMVGYDKYKLLLDFDTNKDAVLGIE